MSSQTAFPALRNKKNTPVKCGVYLHHRLSDLDPFFSQFLIADVVLSFQQLCMYSAESMPSWSYTTKCFIFAIFETNESATV